MFHILTALDSIPLKGISNELLKPLLIHIHKFYYESMQRRFVSFCNASQVCLSYYVIKFDECRNDTQELVNTSYCYVSGDGTFENVKTFMKERGRYGILKFPDEYSNERVDDVIGEQLVIYIIH